MPSSADRNFCLDAVLAAADRWYESDVVRRLYKFEENDSHTCTRAHTRASRSPTSQLYSTSAVPVSYTHLTLPTNREV